VDDRSRRGMWANHLHCVIYAIRLLDQVQMVRQHFAQHHCAVLRGVMRVVLVRGRTRQYRCHARVCRFRIKKHISGKRGETCIYTVRSAMLTVLGASAITSSASGYRHELLHHVLLIPRPTHPVEEAAAAGYSEVLVRFLCLLAPFGRSAKMCTC
jgi:hypothetical protein